MYIRTFCDFRLSLQIRQLKYEKADFPFNPSLFVAETKLFHETCMTLLLARIATCSAVFRANCVFFTKVSESLFRSFALLKELIVLFVKNNESESLLSLVQKSLKMRNMFTWRFCELFQPNNYLRFQKEIWWFPN